MAKKNVRDDPSKTQVTENPQMSDIVLVLDKMELLIQAVSEINKNGKYSTVPADKEHQNSFLKIDRYATFFENFLKNFWSQLKDPTHFGLFTMKEEEFDKPEVKQAIEDLAEGKKTKAVEEFLKKYEITPKNQTEQSINNQNSEEMAKKNQTQQPVVEANDQQQNNQYRYNESMINWDQLKNFGLSREYLQERGLLDSMLKGYKTNQLVPINLNFGSAVLRTDARLSLQQSNTGEVVLAIHGIRKQPELERPYFGHIFSEEDKKNLLETGNMGRVVELKGRNGEYIPSFISLDKMTNEVVAMRAENVYIPNEIKGVQLTDQEKNDLREGRAIFLNDMVNNRGEEFSSFIKADLETGRLMYSRTPDGFEERAKFEIPKEIFGAKLSGQQRADLQSGKSVLVEGMKGFDGKSISQYVKLNSNQNKLDFYNENPDRNRNASQRNVVAEKQEKRQSKGQSI